jgi:hypothetical protein
VSAVDDLERQLNSILSDPKQMEQIAGLARSLMGDGAQGTTPEPGPDTALLGRIASLMQSGGEGREQALLKAMEPYLSEKRRGKLENALKLARLARIARLAMETGGRDEAL